MTVYERLPEALLRWYGESHRELPWRQDREPYHIWLSEIMLQQTRVEAVKGYYARFLEALPTIEALADSEDDHLHKLWEGLGYYSRVCNLKKAAQIIVTQYGGQFPREYAQVRALPGIGPYTAGAICSIAFDQPRAAVDGNVLRVVARLTESETPIDTPSYRRSVEAALEEIYPPQAGQFTQALMELGATLCGPNRPPQCNLCPCRDFCGGALHGTAERFPIKTPKAPRKVEFRTVFVFSCQGQYAVEKRPNSGLLAGLWQFPDVTGHLEMAQATAQAENWGLHPREIYRQLERRHIFTHIQWEMRGIYMEVAQPEGDFVWMTAEEINKKAALPTAFRQFWEENQNV